MLVERILVGRLRIFMQIYIFMDIVNEIKFK